MSAKQSIHNSIDVMKLILSILVVAIHVRPVLEGYDFVLLLGRIAVPVFFITSGYFFFRKLNGLDDEGKRVQLIHFLKRNIRLYLSWMIVFFPLIIWYRGLFKYEIIEAILRFIRSFFFGSTFIASWYLMALMIGMPLVYLLSKRFNNTTIFILSLAIYLACCCCSGYGKLLNYPIIEGQPQIYNSFPVSLLWISIGKIVAENESLQSPNKSRIVQHKYLIGMICIALYIAEYYFCMKNMWANSTDSLISLVPLCTFIFVAVKNMRVSFIHSFECRVLSTIIYCSHGTIACVGRPVLRRLFGFTFDSSWQCMVLYLSVIISCVCLFFVIYYGSRRIKLLKNFY